LGVASNRGFFVTFPPLVANGDAAGFFPDPAFDLAGWSLRIKKKKHNEFNELHSHSLSQVEFCFL